MKKLIVFLILTLGLLSGTASGKAYTESIFLSNGATDVNLYILMEDAADDPCDGLTVTNFDMYYLEDGTAWCTKRDANALGSAVAAHDDWEAHDCNFGVYRVDFPDAAFDGGVGKQVILYVTDAATANTSDVAILTVILTDIATATNQATIAGYIDTEIAAILADTNDIQEDWSTTIGYIADLWLDAG